MPVHNIPQSALLCLLATPCILISGCTHQNAIALDTHGEGLVSQSVEADLLTELDVLTVASAATPLPDLFGPQLIAGDWLAWQCAFAGSYWDMPLQDGERHYYAGAYESEIGQYELEY